MFSSDFDLYFLKLLNMHRVQSIVLPYLVHMCNVLLVVDESLPNW